MTEMRELTIDELDAVGGGEVVNCTVTKVYGSALGYTWGEVKCENGQTGVVIQKN